MSSFANSTQSQSGFNGIANAWANPLGPTSLGPNGAPRFSVSGAAPLGAQTLNYLGASMPQMNQAGQAYATALQGAAAAPGWGAAQTNATSTAAGDYLAGSPELNRALAQNNAVAGAGAADAAAREQSTMAKNGMAWGTGQQQVEQAATAQGNEAAANTNAQAYLQNYQAERGAQNQAGNQLSQAYGAPLSYLSGVPGAYTSGLTPAASLISGLGSGGQIYSDGTTDNSQGEYNPSVMSDINNAIGSL